MDEGQDACAGREQRGTWAKSAGERERAKKKLKLLRGQSQRPPDAGDHFQKKGVTDPQKSPDINNGMCFGVGQGGILSRDAAAERRAPPQCLTVISPRVRSRDARTPRARRLVLTTREILP